MSEHNCNDWCGPDPEPNITPESALCIIAQELRYIRHLMHDGLYDPNCETTLDRIATELNKGLGIHQDSIQHAIMSKGDE